MPPSVTLRMAIWLSQLNYRQAHSNNLARHSLRHLVSNVYADSSITDRQIPRELECPSKLSTRPSTQ